MSEGNKWVRITDCQNIPVREGRRIEVGGRFLALFNLGDRFLAVDDQCPHRGGPLSDGILSGTTVVCPLHAWKIDLESGHVLNSASTVDCINRYPTRIEDRAVLVELSFLNTAVCETTIAPSQQDRPIRWVRRVFSTPPEKENAAI